MMHIQFFCLSDLVNRYICYSALYSSCIYTCTRQKKTKKKKTKKKNAPRRTNQLSERSQVMEQFRLYMCKRMPVTTSLHDVHIICKQGSNMCE